MSNMPESVLNQTTSQAARPFDPIIEREDVMWAARRFILLYGDKATEVVRGEIKRLDLSGKLQVAEMFSRVEVECDRLLKRSENLRLRDLH